MDAYDIKKSQVQNVNKIVEYVPKSVVIKSIINKPTGSICAVALDSGEVLNGKIVPFDTFIQVIDGKAEILIDDNSNLLIAGQSIIIPAHCRNSAKANVKFKMLSTTIKSGYEEDGWWIYIIINHALIKMFSNFQRMPHWKEKNSSISVSNKKIYNLIELR